MRAVVQRVSRAAVSVEGQRVGEISNGLLVLLGVGVHDSAHDSEWLADKITQQRVFEDGEGKMNHSLLDVAGQMLIVSQFTLYGEVRKGRRPSFTEAAPPAVAETLYQEFVDCVRRSGITVQTGKFGAKMQVDSINEGPVTLFVDTKLIH
jgi:D-tyrosyl-tRNA(Tyr) deacylase